MKLFLQASLFFCLSYNMDVAAQEKFDFYISNSGNDTYPGTSSQFPKKTISGCSAILENFSISKGNVKVGLKSGDIFDENLVTSYPIQLKTFAGAGGQKEFVILNGTKEFSTGWIKATAAANTYKQFIPYTGFVGYGIGGIGTYSYIYVIEIDKALEKTAPFTARKVMRFVSDSTTLDHTPGSFYIPVNGTENPKPVSIHTSDGKSPNAHIKYRYEVTVRDWAVNSTYQPNNQFENLWVRGFGAGIGMLPGGENSSYNKIVFGPGAGIHHLVVRSGTINHSLFLPGPKNTNYFAVVFYDVEGLQRRGTIKNSLFLDIPFPVYAHTSFGSNYAAVELDHVVAFADKTEGIAFMYTANTDSVILNNVYAEGYIGGYYYGSAKYASISNSAFKDVTFGIAYAGQEPIVSPVKNVFIKTTGTDFTSGIGMNGNSLLTLSNSVLHIKNNIGANGSTAAGFVTGAGGASNQITAAGNIFICDIDPANYLNAATTNTDSGRATSKDKWENNVYILLKGKNISWTVTNPATNGGSYTVQNFEAWKQQSGQDRHSLFFDLRYDSRGLKAIFTDPENGNYDLANTPEGNQISALRAGMTDPITCFIKKPSYEQAADLVQNNKALSVNTCRNPCRQNKLRISATFDLVAINNRQIKLNWNISEQQNIDYYEIQQATGNSFFKRVASIPVTADSIYAFTRDLQPGIIYQFRLMIVAKTGSKCYSDARTIKITDSKPFTIYPNPTSGKIFVSMNGYRGPVNFTVFNSIGQTVLVKESLSLYNAIEVDLTGFQKGVYELKAKTANGTAIQKFILQ